MNSNKLTIVIPTYNRYSRLLRLLRYMKKSATPYKISILDSSSNPLTCAELKSCLSSENISYQRFKPEISIHLKIYEGLKKITSSYVVICADDDLLVTTALTQGVDFLEENHDFSLVHGQSLWFDLQFKADANILTNSITYPQREITGETASRRLIDHLSNYTTSFYSLQRTECLKRSLQISSSWQMDLYLSELLLSCLSIIQGKFKKIDRLLLIRERYGYSDLRRINRKKRDFFDVVTDSNFSSDYVKLADLLSEELSRVDRIELLEAKDLVKKGVWRYLSKVLRQGLENISPEVGTGKISLKKRIKDFPGIKGYILPNWRKLKNSAGWGMDGLSQSQLLKPSSRYYDDFMPAYRQILEPLKDDG